MHQKIRILCCCEHPNAPKFQLFHSVIIVLFIFTFYISHLLSLTCPRGILLYRYFNIILADFTGLERSKSVMLYTPFKPFTGITVLPCAAFMLRRI